MTSLSKDLLIDLAGWAAMKQARTIVAAGGVAKSTADVAEGKPILVKGLVLEGKKRFPCGLVIRSKSDAENLCRCPAARREGQICAHSVAVALATLQAEEAAEAEPAQPSAARETTPAGELEISEIPTRLPLQIGRHPQKKNCALLTRPPLGELQFMLRGADLFVVDPAEQQAVPTRLAETPRPFQAQVAPLLRDPASEARLEISPKFLRSNGDHLHCMFHVECSDDLMNSLRVLPGEPQIRLEVEGSLNRIDLKLSFDYPGETVANPPLEEAAVARISRAEWGEPRRVTNPARTVCSGFIRGENAILDFYAGELDRILAENQWQVDIGERFARLTRDIEKIRPQIETLSSGEDWLAFDLKFTADGDSGDSIAEAEIRRLLETGQSRTQLPSGRKAAVDRTALADLFQAFEDVDADQSRMGQGSRLVSNTQRRFYIESAIGGFSKNFKKNHDAEIGTPEALQATLRPYQSAGLGWLNERVARGVGAILADEMGLGKTVQALALVAVLRESGARRPMLVVAPTSLVPTWQHEARRFLPDLRVLTLHGPTRQRYFEVMSSADLVLTSYAALVRDVERYPADLEFELCVADEASYIKNPRTKTAKATLKIPAFAHLALTGTPVENSLQDLWSIMQFTNPGYLGRREDFIARFGSPDADSGRQLRRRLAPFLLRRRKAQVASDLPEKIERIIYCDLLPKQRKTYETLIRENRKKIANIQTANGWQHHRMAILTLLLRLRQTCCDLRLLDSDAGRYADSAKLQALETLLEEALSGGHRVLIFSQFVSMLQLVRKQLETAGHSYAYLDGSTPAAERGAQVEAFQAEGSEIPIFLISLKAGGYGLTLTAADTVIHLDPWWNPAVEAQATDRAHRIGQTNPVTAYKFIATGTVEEKILKLQERKRALIDTALDDERPLMSSLTQEDLAYILS